MEQLLKTALAQHKAKVDQGLAALFKQELSTTSRILPAMAYSMFAGGKRIRPILCLTAAETVGGNAEAVLPVAMAIEMIHTYSLIHDDLPAMDNDSMRRGKPTCHIAYDEATAILAGDALLTLAFETASHPRLMRHHDPALVLRVIHKLAQASGYNGMVDGQMRDIQAEGAILPLSGLEHLHQRKTGAIIEASVYSGGALGGATKRQLDHIEQYARHIGIAYQVVDDVLNVEGDPEKLGKATGTDRQLGKNTYPALIGLHAAKAYAQQKIDEALNALEIFDKKADLLRALARYILARQH